MGAVSKSKRDTKHQSISLLISLSFYFREKMNSLALVLLLATGLSAVSAGIDDIVDVHNGNANEFADSILKNLRVRILKQGLDPLILPVKSFEFSKKVLLVEIRGSAKVMNIGPSFGVKVFMESVGITFEVVQSIAKGSKPTLLSFGIVDLGKITTELDGDLNILDFILSKLNNFVINLVKDVVVTALEIPLKKLVQEILNNNELPDLTASRY